MATCPFLSYTPINTAVGSNQVVENTSGGVVPFEFGTFTYSYGSRVNVECIGSSCQIWDSTNSRCGMLVSNTIVNIPVNQTTTLITLLESVLGKASERDSSKSIVVWLKDIIGITSERDSSKSFMSWLKDIIGITSEQDSGHSIVSWLKTVIGNSTSAAEAIITHTTPTGPCQECGQPSTLVNLMKHADFDHDNSATESSTPPMAVTLIVEYKCEEDRDNNSKVYGKDFKCITDVPKMLTDIEKNDWTEPPLATTWAEYKTWMEGGAAPVFITNPDL